MAKPKACPTTASCPYSPTTTARCGSARTADWRAAAPIGPTEHCSSRCTRTDSRPAVSGTSCATEPATSGLQRAPACADFAPTGGLKRSRRPTDSQAITSIRSSKIDPEFSGSRHSKASRKPHRANAARVRASRICPRHRDSSRDRSTRSRRTRAEGSGSAPPPTASRSSVKQWFVTTRRETALAATA